MSKVNRDDWPWLKRATKEQKSRVQGTIDYIKAHPRQFKMSTWLKGCDDNVCGTVGCIAGTGVALYGNPLILGLITDKALRERLEVSEAQLESIIEDDGAEVFGFNAYEAQALFLGEWIIGNGLCPIGVARINRGMAVQMLEGILDGSAVFDENRQYWVLTPKKKVRKKAA